MCSFTVTDTVHVDGLECRIINNSRNDEVIITFFANELLTTHKPLYLIKGEAGLKESSRITCYIPNGCTEVSIEVFYSDITHTGGLQRLRVIISGEGLLQERILT